MSLIKYRRINLGMILFQNDYRKVGPLQSILVFSPLQTFTLTPDMMDTLSTWGTDSDGHGSGLHGEGFMLPNDNPHGLEY